MSVGEYSEDITVVGPSNTVPKVFQADSALSSPMSRKLFNVSNEGSYQPVSLSKKPYTSVLSELAEVSLIVHIILAEVSRLVARIHLNFINTLES